MSSQVPNRGSISWYVSGAKPRSPDDGNGGRMWTPWNRPARRPIEQGGQLRQAAAQRIRVGEQLRSGRDSRRDRIPELASRLRRRRRTVEARGLTRVARPESPRAQACASSSLHRALEQRGDDLALEEEEHDERRQQDEDRARAQSSGMSVA